MSNSFLLFKLPPLFLRKQLAATACLLWHHKNGWRAILGVRYCTLARWMSNIRMKIQATEALQSLQLLPVLFIVFFFSD